MDQWNTNILQGARHKDGWTNFEYHQFHETLGKHFVNSLALSQQGDSSPAQWLQHYDDGVRIEKLNCRYIQICKLLRHSKWLKATPEYKMLSYSNAGWIQDLYITHKSWLVRRERQWKSWLTLCFPWFNILTICDYHVSNESNVNPTT